MSTVITKKIVLFYLFRIISEEYAGTRISSTKHVKTRRYLENCTPLNLSHEYSHALMDPNYSNELRIVFLDNILTITKNVV